MSNNKESDKDIAIRVDNVSKDFNLPHEKQNNIKYKIVHPFKAKSTVEKQHALKNISFEVRKGEFFGIVGRNGSGKSTLLKILAEIYTPTKGSITVNGSLTPFIELGVGFNPELTGRENIYLNGAMLGFSTKEMQGMYDEIVSFAELEKFMDQKLKNYSSGMQVRLAFSVAIRAKSDILLLDEVLAVGDADFQRKCFNYFKTLKREGQTVILVTHGMSAIREYCNRALLLDESKIKKIGKPEKIADAYTDLFQGSKVAREGSNKKRSGNKSLIVEKLSTTYDKKNITVSFNLMCKKRVTNPLIGFKIKSSLGQPLMGTNNRIQRVDIEELAPGEKIKIDWIFPNVLTQGEYIIDSSVLADDGLTVYDRWMDAATFEITKKEITPYPFTPEVKIVLTEM